MAQSKLTPPPQSGPVFTQISPEELKQLEQREAGSSVHVTGPGTDINVPTQLSKKTIQKVADVALPAIGATAGTVFGARGGPSGAITGSTVGSVAGDVASLALRPVLTGDVPTPDEIKTRLWTSAVAGGGTEGLVQGGGKLVRGFLGELKPMAKEAGQMLMAPVTRGRVTEFLSNIPGFTSLLPKSAPAMLPHQMTNGWLANFADNIIQSSMFGGGTAKKILGEQGEKVLAESEALRRIHMPPQAPEDIGLAVQKDAVKAAGKVSKDIPVKSAPTTEEIGTVLKRATDKQGTFWRQLMDHSAGPVDTENLSATAREIMAKSGKWSREMYGKIAPMLEKFAALGGEVAPEDAIIGKKAAAEGNVFNLTHATALAGQLDSFLEKAPKNAAGDAAYDAAREMRSLLQQAIDKAAPKLGGNVEAFRTQFLRDAALKHPKELGEGIFGAPVAAIEEVKKLVPSKDWTKVENATLDRLLKRPDGSLLSTKEIDKNLEQFGTDRLNSLLGKDARAKLGNYRRNLSAGEFDFLTAQAEKQPSEIGAKLLHYSPEDLKILWNSSSATTRKRMEQATVEHLLDSGGKEVASPVQIGARLKSLGEKADLLLTPETKEAVTKLSGVMAMLREESAKTGSLMIQTGQARSIPRISGALQAQLAGLGFGGGLAASGHPKSGMLTAGAFIVGPYAMAKILMSPAARNAVLTASRTTVPSIRSRALLTLSTFLLRNQLLDKPPEDEQ